MTRSGSVVLITLLMAVTMGGCAAQSATTTPAPASGTYATDAPTAASARDAYADASSALSQAVARPRLGEFVVNGDVRDIHFEFDSYAIRPADTRILDASVQWLKAHPGSLVVIEGHADERGTSEYNVTLGERRARASMSYFVSRGIQATRITVTSYGEERGVCRDHTEGCWSQNRRAHFLVRAR